MPAAPYGGQRLMKEFIKQEILYPENALENKIEGTVQLMISLDARGMTENISIYGSVDPELDREAIRIMQKILWEPALSMGSPVPDHVYQEIEFQIRKYERICRERGYSKPVYPHQPVDLSDRIYQPAETDSPPYPLFQEKGMTLSGFITSNIVYPEEAYRNDLSGTETVQFIVEPSGRISNIKSMTYLGAGFYEETIRLIKLLRWYPGIVQNTAVRVMMNISITFRQPQQGDFQYVPTFLNNSMQ